MLATGKIIAVGTYVVEYGTRYLAFYMHCIQLFVLALYSWYACYGTCFTAFHPYYHTTKVFSILILHCLFIY